MRTLYYPHRYKHDKQSNIMAYQDVKQKVLDTNLSIQEEAYFWLLYYCGCRKSEAYERVTEDFSINDTHLIVDFHQRKKAGAEVDPLELPLHWYGIDKIVECVETANKHKPLKKALFSQKNKEKIKTIVKGRWVFPKIQSTKAWEIVKKVLGEKYYPHFLRLNRLTEIARDPTSNLARLKSYSGIKSVAVLNEYLGKSKKEQQAAIEWMDKQYT